MHTNTTVALKTNFMSSWLCGNSLNMHILRALSKFKIFIIKIPKDSLDMFLILNAVFIAVYHVKAVQDDISAKTIPI